MQTINNKVHTFTTDSTNCKENGGSYFMVGTNSQIPQVANRYTISCNAKNSQIGTVTTDVCFTTATFAAVGTDLFGENVCTTTIPAVTIPAACDGSDTSTIFSGDGTGGGSGGDDSGGTGTGGDSGGDDGSGTSGDPQIPTGDINIIFS
jgi:hypothetical protein